MKKWLVRIGLATLTVAALLAALVVVLVLNSLGTFSRPTFETVAPRLPHLSRPAVLVFSKASGFVHEEAIPAAKARLQSIADANRWSIFMTDSGAVFNPEQLDRFDVVVWNNVTGDVLTPEQRAAFARYLEGGGGFVGIHAAGDDSHAVWPWYTNTVIRAEFIGHPLFPHIQQAAVHPEDRDNPVVGHLPETWRPADEWYSFAASPRGRGSNVLLRVDESTYQATLLWKDLRMGNDHPIVWQHCIGSGRALYSALGHTARSYDDEHHIAMLERAIAWAAGLTWDGYRCPGQAAVSGPGSPARYAPRLTTAREAPPGLGRTGSSDTRPPPGSRSRDRADARASARARSRSRCARAARRDRSECRLRNSSSARTAG